MLYNNKKIIPIFYNVKPSDLRWLLKGKGVYAFAFSQHEVRLRDTRQKVARNLEKWRKALYNVSFLNGFELNNKRDEGRLLKNIVHFVLEDLKHVPLEVARFPVGLNEIVEDFEKKFQWSDHEGNVNIVGIVGMGGSGKTTLAKEYYNKEFLKFKKRSCFISNVRDVAAKSSLHKLQNKLLRDLLSERFKLRIDNIVEGKGILRARLRSLRVLIVLDDVDDVEQINALLPEKDIFAEGSLIIVTTRELNVLHSLNISCIYRMKALKSLHAKELFCRHAFMPPDPVQEFEGLVEKATNACQGLPLSLKVLGEQLYGKPKDYWNSHLIKISRILPEDITKRLKISFDALDREEKEMFLDTACCFLGEEKNIAIEVWNDSGWSGLHGFEMLLSKCLVELDQQNRIRMHDHLRDMGRQIAMERPPYGLFPSANLGIRRQAQERISIRGIMEASTDRQWYIAKLSSHHRPLLEDYIELKPSSCGVQLLVGAMNECSEEFATLSKEICWLRLFKFQQSCLPSWLSLENLRVLELYDAPNLEELWPDNMQRPPLHLEELWQDNIQRPPLHLEELWQDNIQQPPLPLRELIIDFGREKCSFKRFPRSIGRLRRLKKLSCSGGRCLQNLPEGFCNLQSLEHLELQNLGGLLSLPNRFGDLTNLRHLNLKGCIKLKMLPDSFKQLKHLQYLNLEGCCNLPFTERNADILENIKKLQYLSFRGCKRLQVVPHHITNQALLRELDLIETDFSQLPSSFGQLESLEVLKIGGSKELVSLPESLGNLSRLTHLEIRDCEKVRSLPESLGRLALLKSIEIGSTGVKSLPREFRQLTNLQRLTIKKCPELAELPSFAEFASMKEIKIRGCQISGKMDGLEQLTSLETLEVTTQWEVPGITSLEHAQGLRRLRLLADNTGALEPCIRTLQKWPGEVIICARALGGVESLIEAFTSSNLNHTVVDGDDGAYRNDESHQDEGDEEAGEDGRKFEKRKTCSSHEGVEWRLRYPETCLSYEATIVCCVLNCPSQEAWVWSTSHIMEKVNLREGKWVWIHVSHGTFEVKSDLEIRLDKESSVEKGLIGTGEERQVRDVFYQVLDAFKK